MMLDSIARLAPDFCMFTCVGIRNLGAAQSACEVHERKDVTVRPVQRHWPVDHYNVLVADGCEHDAHAEDLVDTTVSSEWLLGS